MKYSDLINLSINQTMSRTLLTSLTTMLGVLALLVFGGGTIFDFALVMFFGMIVGTYSSIFIAGAFINTWHKKATKRAREATTSKKAVASAN